MNNTKALGERLKHARKFRKLSGKALAESVVRLGGDLTKAAVSGLEVGSSKQPQAHNALYIARTLQIRVEWLIAGELPMENTMPTAVRGLIEKLMKIKSDALRDDILKSLHEDVDRALKTQSAAYIERLANEAKSRNGTRKPKSKATEKAK